MTFTVITFSHLFKEFFTGLFHKGYCTMCKGEKYFRPYFSLKHSTHPIVT